MVGERQRQKYIDSMTLPYGQVYNGQFRFSSTSSVEPMVSSLDIPSLIPRLVSDEDNLMLFKLPSL